MLRSMLRLASIQQQQQHSLSEYPAPDCPRTLHHMLLWGAAAPAQTLIAVLPDALQPGQARQARGGLSSDKSCTCAQGPRAWQI